MSLSEYVREDEQVKFANSKGVNESNVKFLAGFIIATDLSIVRDS